MQLARHSGNAAILLLASVNLILWLLFPPGNEDLEPEYTRQLAAEMISTTAMTLMAMSLYLSTRPRYLESLFGGLDRMYLTHKNAGLAAMLLLVAHFMVMPLDVSTDSSGNPLGIAAFVGILLLILLSVSPRLPLVSVVVRMPYSRWLKTHRFIGIFFIIGYLHAISVNSLILSESVLFIFLSIIFAFGAASYLYAELLSRFFKRPLAYSVESVQRLNGTTIEIALKPDGGRKLAFQAGQFAFVSFPEDRSLREPHPFTISSSPGDDELKFAIKASGDWTRLLNDHLETGIPATVDGSYGRFNYLDGGGKQIWIAGGIGITPFMSWIRSFDDAPQAEQAEIALFYTARSEHDLLFAQEIASADQRFDHFSAQTRISGSDGSLTVEQIAATVGNDLSDTHIYMCGPIGMIDAMRDQFKRRGVSRGRIHYEEFNFR